MTRIRIVFILTCFIAVSGSAQTQNVYNPEAIKFNDKAVEFINNGNLDSALLFLEKATEIDSNYYLAYCNKSNIFIKKGEYKKAILELENAIEAKPDFAETVFYLGMLYDFTQSSEKANELYRKSIKLFDERLKKHNLDQVGNRSNRAVAMILLGNVSEGNDELKKLIDKYPENIIIQKFLNFDKEKYFYELFVKH